MSNVPNSDWFTEFLKAYGATWILAAGGNFADLQVTGTEGRYIRIAVDGERYRQYPPVTLEKAQKFAQSLIIRDSWSRKTPSVNGIHEMDEWNWNEDGVPFIHKQRFGSENADTYYDKARELIDSDPQASIPYLLFYLAVRARERS